MRDPSGASDPRLIQRMSVLMWVALAVAAGGNQLRYGGERERGFTGQVDHGTNLAW